MNSMIGMPQASPWMNFPLIVRTCLCHSKSPYVRPQLRFHRLPYIIMDHPIFVIAEWATLLVDIHCPRGGS